MLLGFKKRFPPADIQKLHAMQREYAAEYAAAPEGRKAGPMLGIADCVMEEALIHLEQVAEAKP